MKTIDKDALRYTLAQAGIKGKLTYFLDTMTAPGKTRDNFRIAVRSLGRKDGNGLWDLYRSKIK